MSTPARSTVGYVLAVLAVMLVATGLRVYRLGAECFDCDELYAVRIQGVNPKAVAAVMARDGFHTNHPPLMSVPFLVWNALFGTSEFAVRALPLLSGLVAVAGLVAVGAVLGRRWAGVFAAALLAINPLHITYSTEARQYALLVALLVVAQLLLILSLRNGARSLVLAYYLIAAWAALTHYFAVPVLLAHGAVALAILWKSRPLHTSAARLLLAVVLAGLPYLAWLPVMRFQSNGKWDHLTPLTPGSLGESLADLLGLGGWGVGLGFGLSLIVLLLMALGVAASWRLPFPVTNVAQRLLPQWLGWLILALGFVLAIGWIVAFPRSIEPVARETLSGYGYDPEAVSAEVRLLQQTGLLGAGCVVLAGLLLLRWGRWETKQILDSPTGETSISVGVLLTIFLTVPVIVIALGGLTGVRFHQTRNLLVLLPTLDLAVGFGLAWLTRSWPGCLGVAAILVGATVAVGQYQVIGRVVGVPGIPLGMETLDWHGVQTWLTKHPPQDRVVLLVNRPATDPALYYLANYQPQRSPDVTFPQKLPPRVIFVHLVGNPHSESLRDALGQWRSPQKLLASGNGWEIYGAPEP